MSSSSTSKTSTTFTTTTPSSFKAEKYVIHTSSEEEEFLQSTKKVHFASEHQADGVDGPKQSEKKHATAFNFPVLDPRDRDIYFTVKGEKRRGLIVDPGAASGLIGSETLRDLVEHCLKGQNYTIDKGKVVPVSGINGNAEETLGQVSLPLKSGGSDLVYTADVLRLDGSLCPAPIGNPSLRRLNATIMSNFFQNGGGLLVIDGRKEDETSIKMFRLLLTDSEHYIIPTDYPTAGKVSPQSKAEVILFHQKVAEAGSARWNDVNPRIKHCFLSQGDDGQQTDVDRSPLSYVRRKVNQWNSNDGARTSSSTLPTSGDN